jgi:hypothetical protein
VAVVLVQDQLTLLALQTLAAAVVVLEAMLEHLAQAVQA